MTKQKRVFAWLLCIGLALTLFVSSAYIVLEVHHDCTGEDCDICETIAQTEALLQSFALLGAVLLLVAAGLTILKAHRFSDGIRLPAQSTLVSWKVRLNN